MSTGVFDHGDHAVSAGFGSNGVLSKAAKSFAALAGTRSLLRRFYGDISFFSRTCCFKYQRKSVDIILTDEICYYRKPARYTHTHAHTRTHAKYDFANNIFHRDKAGEETGEGQYCKLLPSPHEQIFFSFRLM